MPVTAGARAHRHELAGWAPDGRAGQQRGVRVIVRSMVASTTSERTLNEQIDDLVEEQRIACLWFLRPDYLPSSDQERIGVLEHIQKHGDLAAFRRAGILKRWLSQTSSAASAGS
jgi:hypothetical protein